MQKLEQLLNHLRKFTFLFELICQILDLRVSEWSAELGQNVCNEAKELLVREQPLTTLLIDKVRIQSFRNESMHGIASFQQTQQLRTDVLCHGSRPLGTVAILEALTHSIAKLTVERISQVGCR